MTLRLAPQSTRSNLVHHLVFENRRSVAHRWCEGVFLRAATLPAWTTPPCTSPQTRKADPPRRPRVTRPPLCSFQCLILQKPEPPKSQASRAPCIPPRCSTPSPVRTLHTQPCPIRAGRRFNSTAPAACAVLADSACTHRHRVVMLRHRHGLLQRVARGDVVQLVHLLRFLPGLVLHAPSEPAHQLQLARRLSVAQPRWMRLGARTYRIETLDAAEPRQVDAVGHIVSLNQLIQARVPNTSSVLPPQRCAGSTHRLSLYNHTESW